MYLQKEIPSLGFQDSVTIYFKAPGRRFSSPLPSKTGPYKKKERKSCDSQIRSPGWFAPFSLSLLLTLLCKTPVLPASALLCVITERCSTGGKGVQTQIDTVQYGILSNRFCIVITLRLTASVTLCWRRGAAQHEPETRTSVHTHFILKATCLLNC